MAWNEEKNLTRCLNSLKIVCDELIVVVDDATSDRSETVAKQLGATVYTYPHAGIVEPMRNFAIEKAKGDWILLLDADEEISPGLSSKIKELVASGDYEYVKIPRKNIIFGKWIKSSHWWPDYVYRLFKKDKVSWQQNIHSHPNTLGKGLDLEAKEENVLIHHNYQSISQYVSRLNRYTDFQSQEKHSSGEKFSLQNLITKPVDEFLSQYFARSGHKDGLHGLALSLLQSFSEIVVFLKLWELEKFYEQEISLDDLKRLSKKNKASLNWWLHEDKIKNSKGITKHLNKLVRKISHS